jgi:hypothetical protein
MGLKVKPTFVIDCHDLDRFFRETYDIEINSLEMKFECHNGSYDTFEVDGEKELFSIEDDFLYDVWVNTGQMKDIELPDEYVYSPEYNYNTADIGMGHVMHRLFLDGHIEAGNYLVEYWW